MPFLSPTRLFCQAVAGCAPPCCVNPFWFDTDAAALPRLTVRVLVALGYGRKKARTGRAGFLAGGQPITGLYFVFSLSAWLPVCAMAAAFVGWPVSGCVWAAVSCASCLTTSSVSSINCITLIC